MMVSFLRLVKVFLALLIVLIILGLGKGSQFTVILPTVEPPDFMPMVAETTRGHPRKFLEILVVEGFFIFLRLFLF